MRTMMCTNHLMRELVNRHSGLQCEIHGEQVYEYLTPISTTCERHGEQVYEYLGQPELHVTLHYGRHGDTTLWET